MLASSLTELPPTPEESVGGSQHLSNVARLSQENLSVFYTK